MVGTAVKQWLQAYAMPPILQYFLGGMAGCVLYYALPFEPSLWALLALFLSGIAGCFLTVTLQRMRWLSLCLCLAMLGYAGLRSHMSPSPHVPSDTHTVWVRGQVKAMDATDTHQRLLLEKLDLWTPETKRFGAHHTPTHLRLNVRTDIAPEVAIGSYVATKAVLTPPVQKPVVPGAYDFRFIAHHGKIGGVGYTVDEVALHGTQAPQTNLMQLRELTAKRINAQFDAMGWKNPNTAALANALLTGKRHMIEDEVQDTLRSAGLGHLLAISGLHMALIMFSGFWAIRRVASLIPAISLHYNVKSIAAVAAILLGGLYLILSGMPISAQRAYIMAGLFFVAVVFARVHQGRRLVIIAGWIVLLLAPHQVVGPSFQMSFMAVWMLICVFLHPAFYGQRKDLSWLLRAARFIGMMMLSALVANIAVLPFSLSHFGTYSSAGIIANVIAIPLASMWIMPFGLLALLLMPFGLEMPALYVMGMGLEVLQFYASFIDNLGLFTLRTPTPHGAWVALAVAGLMIGTATKAQQSGVVLYVVAVLGMIAGFFWRPDIIVLEPKKGVVMQSPSGSYVWWKRSRSGFTKDMVAHYLGVEGIMRIKPEETQADVACKKLLCDAGSYKAHFYDTVKFTHQATGEILKITPEMREEDGAHAIWVTKDGFRVNTITAYDQGRIWTLAP